jgi:IclR family KDG regulon transcriptional repressor
VKQGFILTCPRFYLQCPQRQENSPSPHDAGKVTTLPATLRRSKTIRPRPTRDAGSSKSLQKALRLLLHLGEYGPEMSMTQLAGELRLNKSTVYRLLSAMRNFGLIEKNPDNERYRLGLKLHELGCRALESRTLRSEAHPFLAELSRRCNESVSIAVPGAGGIVCLDRVDSLDSIITARTPIGGRFHPHCTAAGKAILAWLPDPEILAIIKRNGMPCFTSATIVKYADLMTNLDLTRRQGFATDFEELERGLSGIAAPVFMRGSHLVAAVGIAGPTNRFQREELTKKITLIKDFAARISRALGRRTSELPVATRGTMYDPFS